MNRRMAAILAALLAAAPAGAESGPGKISDLADELQRIQIRIASGDKAAYAEQIAELKAIGAAIAAARPETWREKREANSLILYVLSGGALADAAQLIRSDALVESERPLARGALAYITNHEREALRLLGPIDPGSLDGSLAGQIAFARSVLETTRNPKAAVSLLDWARLLAPGGLVEEAALRREISVLAEQRDALRTARLTHEYAVRFGASLYAPAFFSDLARLVGGAGLASGAEDYKLFSGAASALPAKARLDFLLTLAKAAVVACRFEAAFAAATEVLRDAPPNGPDEARARLYLTVAQVFSQGGAPALAGLQGLSDAKLDHSDAVLLGAARIAAAQIKVTPGPVAVEAQAASATGPEGGGAALTIRDAEAALERTASLAVSAGAAP